MLQSSNFQRDLDIIVVLRKAGDAPGHKTVVVVLYSCLLLLLLLVVVVVVSLFSLDFVERPKRAVILDLD